MEDKWKSALALKDSLETRAGSVLASAQDLARQAGDRAWTAGKAASEVIGEKAEETALRAWALSADASLELRSMADRVLPVVNEKVELASQHARQLSSRAVDEVKGLGEQAATTLRKLDENHEVIAERVETVSMAAGIASGAAAAAAFVAAPSGLAAAGVAIGVTSAPLIVVAAPVLGAVATVAGAVSGGTYFYSKWKRGRKEQETPGKPDKPLDNSASAVGQLTVPQEEQNQAAPDSLPKT